MTEFNYDSDGPDIETIRSIAAEMAGDHKPRPPTDAERQEHERWRHECWQRDQQMHAEYERQQTEKAEAERAEAERQAAVVYAANREKARTEYVERTNRQTRDRTLTNLLDHAVQQRQYRDGFAKSAQMASSRQRLSKALNAAMSNPPPLTEATVVVVSEDDGSADLGSRNFDAAKWAKKPRSWF